MTPYWPILMFLLLSGVRGACDGASVVRVACNGVSVVRVSDGKLAAKDSPAFFDTFRDMVLNADEVAGKVALIQWGRHGSTIKILGLKDGKCSKHTVPIGRENGLEGANYYDFSSDAYVLHDRNGLRFFPKKSKPREVPNVLPQDYASSTMVPCEGGLLIGAAHGAVSDRFGVYYYLQSDNSMKKIYEASDGIRGLGSGGDHAIIVEDVKGDYRSRRILRIAFDGQVLSSVKAPALSANTIQIKKDTLWEVGPYDSDRCQLQEESLERGAVLQKVEFPDVPGRITCFDVKNNIAVVGRSTDAGRTAEILDIKEKKILGRLSSNLSWSCLLLVKYNGEMYCVASD